MRRQRSNLMGYKRDPMSRITNKDLNGSRGEKGTFGMAMLAYDAIFPFGE